jgi:glycerol-3-phosphate dehydrogenase (NAD(P)+)
LDLFRISYFGFRASPKASTTVPVHIGILGAGSMATACAVVLSEDADRRVTLWGHDAERAEQFQRTRENRPYLPGVTIGENVLVTSDVAAVLADVDLLLVAIPTKFLRVALAPLANLVPAGVPVVSVVKGIENGTFLRPTEIVVELLGARGTVALCGPSHAEEFARRLPCSVVAASSDLALAEHVQQVFTTDRFRVYTNTDVVGVELAGALKNVIAIAAGICDGLSLGDNAKAALLARGLVEMTRFGVAFGAEAETFSGLTGLGDLVTTCCSPHGRNRHVGEQLGRGRSLAEIEASMSSVAEGVTTTRSVYDLALRDGIEMPITAEVYHVLFDGKSPRDAIDDLMGRPLKEEGVRE